MGRTRAALAAVAVATLFGGLLLVAQPAGAGSDQPGQGGSLREQVEESLRELIDRMRPALDRFLGTLEVLGKIDSLEYYEEPEVLPNGDILIRRRADAPPLPPPGAAPDGEPDGTAPGRRYPREKPPEVPGIRT